MQLPDLCDRQRQGDEVNDDAVGRMRERQGVVVHTFSSMLFVPLLPGKADRGTDERGCEPKSDHRRDLEVDHRPYDLSEPLLGEDLEEEQKEGDLDETQSGEICDLADPEVLQQVSVECPLRCEITSLPKGW